MSGCDWKSLHLVLFFVISLWVLVYGNFVQEDGFTFDTPEDVDLAQPVQPPHTKLNHHYAVIGKVFHLDTNHGHSNKGFTVKTENFKKLPHWLIFNRKTATFWGLPLPGDEGTLHITVSSLDNSSDAIDAVIQVVAEESNNTLNRKCNFEDHIILTLNLDKKLRSITPKKRVNALKNMAKFFKLPYSAFTLNSQKHPNSCSHESVSIDSSSYTAVQPFKDTWYLQGFMGCEGKYWTSSSSVNNIIKKTENGTLPKVFGLPLVSWTLTFVIKSPIRCKRQAVDDFANNAGSGDYTEDDYYDDYEDGEYNENEDLGDVEPNPPVSNKPVSLPTNTETIPKITTTTTTTTEVPSSTHPHRHHHGEIKPSEKYDSEILPPVIDEELLIPEVVTEHSTSTTSKPKTFKLDLNYDDDSYDYDAYDDEDDDPVESETIVPIIEDLPKVSSTTTQKSTTTVKSEDEEVKSETPIIMTSSTTSTTTTTTTTTTTETPTTVQIIEDTEPPPLIIYNKYESTTQVTSAATTLNTSESSPTTLDTTSTTLLTTTLTSTTTTEAPAITEPVTIKEATTQFVVNTSTTERLMTTQEEESTTRVTTPRHISTTVTEESVIIPETAQPVDTVPVLPPQNTKPYIEQRLQFKSVIAGKVFRYEIPKNTFKDAEDGYNLSLEVLDGGGQPLSKDSWLQFNPTRRELYGLPLAEDVSNWLYIIRATDKEGASEQDQLTVQVQQHRLERVINHEFSLNLRIEKPQEYPHYVDWSLKILRALGRVYNTNMSEITVRHINHTSEPVVFVWSNDSLATNVCERSEIEELFKTLTANDRGDPSRELSQLLAPDLRVKKVLRKDLTTCEQSQPPAPPVTPTTNFSPILRNPVDKVNATLGELLVYKVKDDTFYDPEDVDPSSLNITLLTADLEAIPPTNWLQFDSKNREFFGIPRKTGRTEYFLLCVDTGGMSAKDSLEVVVHPAVKRPYNVEFSMTIGVPFEEFSHNTAMQRKFVEKLMDIFEETTPANFHFLPFKPKREANFDSTVVYWFNKSLPIESCPIDEIKRLEYMLHSDSRSISSRVHRIMGPEFTVSTIKVHHSGNCKSKPPTVPTQEVPVPSEETPRPQEENDMMITLILPIIIISIMLFVAFVAACILYRKRRIGKMNMEEDGRQSYGNKGIPVIFQEELEEKPEPGTKAPVILKDEKPPLAPPEYSKSGSLKMEDSEPYQPPPPFTRTQDNGRQPRPKPTPTYRKPPPYVPP